MSMFVKAVSGVAGFLFGEGASAATSNYLLSDKTFGGRLVSNLAEGFIGSAVDEATGASKQYEPHVPMQDYTKVRGTSQTSAGTYRSTKVNPDKIGQVERVRQKARAAQQSSNPKIMAQVSYIAPRKSSGRITQKLEGSGLKLRTQR